jgi:hypothetical protein
LGAFYFLLDVPYMVTTYKKTTKKAPTAVAQPVPGMAVEALKTMAGTPRKRVV